ncbi:MAG: ribosomal RNA methyltransferase [Candidatus Magnetoglobus multicellularis str. Araruama]|uniref:Ribosomal RNA methyltransferase n=1 Tax=Candidatus Magnetoglobus multicellularis str. Araruama TaxID=890399 RepID=A0A1V1PC06_9BACT|nr:MAG: ribosomal RNA methyltransferase [Candidatus Magnetoglobus multicellularis str. Araruama]
MKQHLASLVLNQGPSDDIDKIIEGLLSSHVSTQERLPWYQEFYQTLFNLVDPGESIIDIGCGIHPLSYPFDKNNLNTYLAIDKDPVVIDTLTTFAPRVAPVKLIPICMDINHITWSDYLTAQFDLAFVLKLIPVLHRQNKSALKQLIEIPAKQILLTGNIEAMTRKETIRRKERRMLQDFIAMTGRQISGNFEVGNEFGFVIR